MAHTYYSRLSVVNPKDVNSLDPRLGIVIAETATTGRFVMGDISWESTCSPNSLTAVAYNAYCDIKIFEPMGFALFDYIKAAAYQCGIENHLDARFFLEIEILGENLIADGEIKSPFKYIWPLLIVASDVKSSTSEKGSEYNFKFLHSNHHGQTDFVQPIKDTTKIKAETPGDYFDKLSILLENKEYQYAEARQKFGSAATKGGPHPAAGDDYHDEYHFILEPQIRNFTFTNKGTSTPAVQGAFDIRNIFKTKIWNITARPGTTITSQITRVLQSTKEIANLKPGKSKPQTSDAAGSSQASADNNKDMLGEVYQFFRVETYSVYKKFDPIRNRYAVKHVFLVFLADQPNMYQYPDELHELNKSKNKAAVMKKLTYYIQEGLLRKVYYHNYTGLNNDVLKVDLQFNQSYSIPSFPAFWADRGRLGQGPMNASNFNSRVTPYVSGDRNGVAPARVQELRSEVAKVAAEIAALGNPNAIRNTNVNNPKRLKLIELEKQYESVSTQLKEREAELNTNATTEATVNTINSRSELLNSLKFAEDANFKELYDEITENYPSLIPRMEPDNIIARVDIPKEENELLMEKIFSVLLAPKDLINLELEIIGDPYWLCVPNVMLAGKKQLDKIEFSAANSESMKNVLNETMPLIDKTWANRPDTWGDYGQAQIYKGSNLLYFNSQSPSSDWDSTDSMIFNQTDQIVGIYLVKSITNTFKDGLWTQKLVAIRDYTIPSALLPKGSIGSQTFEKFMEEALTSDVQVADELRAQNKEAEKQRAEEVAQNNLVTPSANPEVNAVVNAAFEPPKILDALELTKKTLKELPAPDVSNPVDAAKQMTSPSTPSEFRKTKDQAYSAAKEQYNTQLNEFFKHTDAINKEAFIATGITEYKPYSPETLVKQATKNDGSGLDAWKAGNTTPGPAASNNPGAIGFDPATGTVNKYENWKQGVNAINEYYNFGVGVAPNGKQGTDRLLLPTTWKGTEAEFLATKIKKGP